MNYTSVTMVKNKECHHFTIPNDRLNLGKNHQWLLNLADEKLLGNFLVTGSA